MPFVFVVAAQEVKRVTAALDSGLNAGGQQAET
jgi:hypothetical protein